MKIYLWILHIAGFLLAAMFGLEADRGAWALSLTGGALSAVALWSIVALRIGEKNEVNKPKPQ
ncbi:hypothetical protein [Pseudomonas sp. JG-B]|uniref:hypothetical protein n=1 Tax=Pseudomonas sp. JG-B TaxID=2603214 RepID=UPI0015B58557|nr:hypothetical protein [Pseudomonas sp. JG-B]